MAAPKPTDPALAKVLSGRGGRGRRSPLYLWMREHYEALKAEFALHGPHWAERTKAMGEAGLLDQTGKPPTLPVAQQTWYRVCRDIEDKARGRPRSNAPAAATARPPPETQTATPPAPAPPPGPVKTGAAVDPENPYGFRTSGGARHWPQKGNE